jgi:hypothetical protein
MGRLSVVAWAWTGADLAGAEAGVAGVSAAKASPIVAHSAARANPVAILRFMRPYPVFL